MARRSNAGLAGPYWLVRTVFGSYDRGGYTKLSDARKEGLRTLGDIGAMLRRAGYIEEADYRVGDAILGLRAIATLPSGQYVIEFKTSIGSVRIAIIYKEGGWDR